jgi:hypothetical protein
VLDAPPVPKPPVLELPPLLEPLPPPGPPALLVRAAAARVRITERCANAQERHSHTHVRLLFISAIHKSARLFMPTRRQSDTITFIDQAPKYFGSAIVRAFWHFS